MYFWTRESAIPIIFEVLRVRIQTKFSLAVLLSPSLHAFIPIHFCSQLMQQYMPSKHRYKLTQTHNITNYKMSF